jgi:hypothetical protein
MIWAEIPAWAESLEPSISIPSTSGHEQSQLCCVTWGSFSAFLTLFPHWINRDIDSLYFLGVVEAYMRKFINMPIQAGCTLL